MIQSGGNCHGGGLKIDAPHPPWSPQRRHGSAKSFREIVRKNELFAARSVVHLQHAKSRTGFTVFHLLSSETEVDGAEGSPISSSRSRRTWICSQVPHSTSSSALNLTFPPLQACILFFSVTFFTVYPRCKLLWYRL